MVTLILLSLISVTFTSASSGNYERQRMFDQPHFLRHQNQQFSSMQDTYSSCVLGTAQQCTFSSLSGGAVTNLIYPGGNTSCINSDAPFFFLVKKGSSDKVLFHFQSGGGCVTQNDYNTNLCAPLPFVYGTGILDVANQQNPYHGYTLVEVLSCSGDIHIGHKDSNFFDAKGQPAKQRGQDNTLATLNWVASQQKLGFLSSTLKNLVISGSSAGSIGAQFWANEIIKKVKAINYAVMFDSFFIYLPLPFEMILFNAINVCYSPAYSLPVDLQVLCAANTLTFQAIGAYSIKQNPSTPFYAITSKFDAVQISYSTYPSPEDFFLELTKNVFEPWNAFPNFLLFAVDGTAHTFLMYDYFYTTTNTGCGSAAVGLVTEFNVHCVSINNTVPADGTYSLLSQIQRLPIAGRSLPVKSVCVNVTPPPQETVPCSNSLAAAKSFVATNAICLWGSFCATDSDCSAGSYCRIQPYYSQCVPLSSYSTTFKCVADYMQCGGKFFTAPLSNPAATCCNGHCVAADEYYSSCVPLAPPACSYN